MSDVQLPAGFIPATHTVPENDRPVLAVRKSGYINSAFEIMTARYMIDYRPKSPWRDVGGDSVTDSGADILGWKYADDLLLPTGR